MTAPSLDQFLEKGWIKFPFDPEPPMVTSGVRLRTPAATTRGFGPAEWKLTGELIVEVLDGLAANGAEGNAAVEQVPPGTTTDRGRPLPTNAQ